ncbi:uncharacterized protein LOC119351958 [Triticum dicoccoides]|uniref:uncharacterized protein LOC119351958 n=1 Tax=Triticum dicoccoides TaxID=85692 RepID=UPI00188FAC12|nr:uncharacterized protein LOC119351958 [Triticum dicoccoides]
MCQDVFNTKPNRFFQSHVGKCKNVAADVQKRSAPLVAQTFVQESGNVLNVAAERILQQVNTAGMSSKKRKCIMPHAGKQMAAAESSRAGKNDGGRVTLDENKSFSELLRQGRSIALKFKDMHGNPAALDDARLQLFELFAKMGSTVITEDRLHKEHLSLELPQAEQQVLPYPLVSDSVEPWNQPSMSQQREVQSQQSQWRNNTMLDTLTRTFPALATVYGNPNESWQAPATNVYQQMHHDASSKNIGRSLLYSSDVLSY